MSTRFVIGCLPCGATKTPPQGAAIGRCDACGCRVWITPDQVKKKKLSDLPVWCANCVTKSLRADEDIETVETDNTESPFSEDFAEKLVEVERVMFQRAKQSKEQRDSLLEEAFPSIILAAMATLRIYDKVEDCTVALMIRHLLENHLLNRRETLGPGQVFSCWGEDKVVTLLAFIFGTSKAAHHFGQKIEDGMEWFEDSLTPEEWRQGLEHWRDGFHEGDGQEGWQL